jgi:hypothetical protein
MAVSPDEPRPPLTADEAIRHIMMDIKVTEVNPPGPFDNPALPVVHFAGKSRSIEASWDPNANSRIKGAWRPPTCRGGAHANPNPQAPSPSRPKAKSAGKPSRYSTGTSSPVQSNPSTPDPPTPTPTNHLHSGEERWRSDGIQVGGLRSQRGVIGTWFDKDFDSHGPAGPTAFWKICDRGLDEEDAGDSEDEEGIW